MPFPSLSATLLRAAPVLLALTLVVAQGCDSGGDGATVRTEEAAAERTGGIFGGTVQPPSGGSEGSDGSATASARGTGESGSGNRVGSSGADLQSRAGSPPASRSASPQGVDVSDMGYTVGSDSAPIRVIEFSDFGCGYCRRFHLNVYPTLREEYVEAGRVQWKYIPFVLGIFPNGREAAVAGECVIRHGPDAFPAFRDRLFEDQSAWRDAEDPTDVFVEVAASGGVDAEPLRRCIREEAVMDRVRANNAAGRELGIRGTPSFLVNGFPLHGAQPLEIFRTIFDDMLSRAP